MLKIAYESVTVLLFIILCLGLLNLVLKLILIKLSKWYSERLDQPEYPETKAKDGSIHSIVPQIAWLSIALLITYENHYLNNFYGKSSNWFGEVVIGFIIGAYVVKLGDNIFNWRVFSLYKKRPDLMPESKSKTIWMPFQIASYMYESTFLVLVILFAIIQIPFLLGVVFSPLMFSYLTRRECDYYKLVTNTKKDNVL